MVFDIFENKRIVDGKIDFLSTYAKFDYENIAIKDWVIIDEGSNTSIDMISEIAYGKPDYLDYLVKFNRLNNPLYIPTGTLIMVPELSSLLKGLKYVDLAATSASILSKQTAGLKKLQSLSPGSKQVAASNYIKNSSGSYIF